MNRVGYIDMIGPEELERGFSIDKLRINFLKKPLKSLRRVGTKYFHKHSRIGKTVIEAPGTWKSLDLLYGNEPEKIETGTFTPKHWSDKMFYSSKAADATRNRFKEYIKYMKTLGQEYAETNSGRVGILSLASGPGRDVTEVVEFLKGKGIDVYATCIDKCADAMELGSRIAESKGLSKNITYKRGKIGKMHQYENDNKYDIIITQGIMDYLPDEGVISLLENARKLKSEDGAVLTSNMGKHKWMKFWMETFGGWKLNYRDGKELVKLMGDAGYKEVSVYILPKGYHWMGVGKK